MSYLPFICTAHSTPRQPLLSDNFIINAFEDCLKLPHAQRSVHTYILFIDDADTVSLVKEERMHKGQKAWEFLLRESYASPYNL